MPRMRIARYVLLAILLSAVTRYAWGAKGHAVIAELAERGLSPNVEAQVRSLNFARAAARRRVAARRLARGRNEGSAAGQHRHAPFRNPPNDAAFDRERDCKEDQCVVAGIEKYVAILKDKTLPNAQRREALIFVVHFVGDLHQPMHAAGGLVKDDATGQMIPDQGGNKVKVRFLGIETNLHSIWDSGLIDWGPATVDDYVDHLVTYEMRGRSVEELQRGTIVDWFNDSHYAAVHDAYAIGNGTLGGEYAKKNIGVVYERLLRGGLRLRKVLEDALAVGGM